MQAFYSSLRSSGVQGTMKEHRCPRIRSIPVRQQLQESGWESQAHINLHLRSLTIVVQKSVNFAHFEHDNHWTFALWWSLGYITVVTASGWWMFLPIAASSMAWCSKALLLAPAVQHLVPHSKVFFGQWIPEGKVGERHIKGCLTGAHCRHSIRKLESNYCSKVEFLLLLMDSRNNSSFAISVNSVNSKHPQQTLALNQVSCCKLGTITHELYLVECIKPIAATTSTLLQVAFESCDTCRDTCTRLLSWVVSNVSSPNAQSAPQKLQLWANVQRLAAAEQPQLCSAKICCEILWESVEKWHFDDIDDIDDIDAHCTKAQCTATVQPASTVKGDA